MRLYKKGTGKTVCVVDEDSTHYLTHDGQLVDKTDPTWGRLPDMQYRRVVGNKGRANVHMNGQAAAPCPRLW